MQVLLLVRARQRRPRRHCSSYPIALPMLQLFFVLSRCSLGLAQNWRIREALISAVALSNTVEKILLALPDQRPTDSGAAEKRLYRQRVDECQVVWRASRLLQEYVNARGSPVCEIALQARRLSTWVHAPSCGLWLLKSCVLCARAHVARAADRRERRRRLRDLISMLRSMSVANRAPAAGPRLDGPPPTLGVGPLDMHGSHIRLVQRSRRPRTPRIGVCHAIVAQLGTPCIPVGEGSQPLEDLAARPVGERQIGGRFEPFSRSSDSGS